MFFDKILFDEFDLALIKGKVITRKHAILTNIYSLLIGSKSKCKICGKKIKRKEIMFIPNYGSVHSGDCYITFIKNLKRKE